MPLLVKIAPDLADEDVLEVADLAVALGLDGIIATNTTISRDGLATDPATVEAGRRRRAVRAPAHRARRRRDAAAARPRRPDLTLIGVGGITTPDDARARLDAGATLLQAYTAFIYEGPALAPPDPQGSLAVHDASEPGCTPPSPTADRSASASTRTRRCCTSGASTTTSAGLETFALTVVEAVAPYARS